MGERVVREAAAVAVPTAAVADALRAVLPGLGDRVHVTGGGVAAAFTLPAPTTPTPVVGLPPRYVLSLATLEPRKGLDVLVRALATDAAAGLHLVSVGAAGWGGVDLAAEAAAAGLDPARVHALGRVPDADLVQVMRGARAVVVPSRAEGFGLPVAEAMAVGVPVVCTAVPALTEVAGGAARVVAVDDVAGLAAAVAEVDADDALRTRLVAAGRTRAAAFTWDAVAGRTWDLYRDLRREVHG